MPLKQETKTDQAKSAAGEVFWIGTKEHSLSVIAPQTGCSFLLLGEDKQLIYEQVKDLAKMIVCSQRTADTAVEYCNGCKDCIMVDKNHHPDVLWVEPKGISSSIKIEDIRLFKERINLKPYLAAKKIFIINCAERLLPESANALLKVLEEPPADSLIILIANNTTQLLPTVVSRCKVIRFFPAQISKQEDKNFICELAEKFLDEVDLTPGINFNKQIFALDRNQVEQFLEELAFIFRDIILIKLKVTPQNFISQQSKMALAKWADVFNYEAARNLVDEILDIKNFVHKNANLKLSLDVLCKTVAENKINTAHN